MYTFHLTPLARQDLKDIRAYIRDTLAAPESAKALMLAFQAAFEKACQFPESLPPVTDPLLRQRGYRKIIVKRYIAFVLIDNDRESVDIMRVLYYARKYEDLL